jgi:GNAT superfamily N-acetyltransferase
MGVLHQPHGINKKLKRVSRMVILPDYQGVGIGYKFLCAVAKEYAKRDYTFTIVTSAKNLIYKLSNASDWSMKRLSFNKCSSVKSAIDYKRASIRSKCKTASFEYRG